jgi:hypothetical protein
MMIHQARPFYLSLVIASRCMEFVLKLARFEMLHPRSNLPSNTKRQELCTNDKKISLLRGQSKEIASLLRMTLYPLVFCEIMRKLTQLFLSVFYAPRNDEERARSGQV